MIAKLVISTCLFPTASVAASRGISLFYSFTYSTFTLFMSHKRYYSYFQTFILFRKPKHINVLQYIVDDHTVHMSL